MQNLPKVKFSKLIPGDYLSLREDLLEDEDGCFYPYTTLVCTDAVAVLAQTSDGKWILNREYRHGTGGIILGCSGGRLEPGEDPVTGGKREFLEETGYASDEAICIGCCHPFPALCNQKIYYLWIKNAIKKTEQKLDPLERIEPILLTDVELKERIQKNQAIDGILLAALWYKDHFC